MLYTIVFAFPKRTHECAAHCVRARTQRVRAVSNSTHVLRASHERSARMRSLHAFRTNFEVSCEMREIAVCCECYTRSSRGLRRCKACLSSFKSPSAGDSNELFCASNRHCIRAARSNLRTSHTQCLLKTQKAALDSPHKVMYKYSFVSGLCTNLVL